MAPFTDHAALVTGAGSVPARPLTARRRTGALRFHRARISFVISRAPEAASGWREGGRHRRRQRPGGSLRRGSAEVKA